MVWSNHKSPRFPKGSDCILSKLWMVNPSLFTNTRSVSECLSYPIIADLESDTADYPILHIITIPEFYLGHLKVSYTNLVVVL